MSPRPRFFPSSVAPFRCEEFELETSPNSASRHTDIFLKNKIYLLCLFLLNIYFYPPLSSCTTKNISMSNFGYSFLPMEADATVEFLGMELLGQRKHAFEMLIALAIFPSPKMCQLVMNETECFLKEGMYFYGWSRGATSVIGGGSEAYLRLGWWICPLKFLVPPSCLKTGWKGLFPKWKYMLGLSGTGIPGKWILTEP